MRIFIHFWKSNSRLDVERTMLKIFPFAQLLTYPSMDRQCLNIFHPFLSESLKFNCDSTRMGKINLLLQLKIANFCLIKTYI